MKVIKETLSPTWDEALVFNDIVVYGVREELVRSPPVVIVEVYDYDIVVSVLLYQPTSIGPVDQLVFMENTSSFAHNAD